MAEVKAHRPGDFCWVDLATRDPQAAKRFYTALFGWETHDIPMPQGGFYTMLRIGGKDVAALAGLSEDQKAQGVPPHWQSYVAVASANETAEKVAALGGKVLFGPLDVFEEGRMALLQDPTGATLAVWQARNHIGYRLVNQHGTRAWNELLTNDTDAAAGFYTKLFSWDARVQQMSGTTYTTFMNGGEMAAGMMRIEKEWGDVPPHWMVYFAVDDCDALVDKAVSLGAKTLVPPQDIPEIGRFATVEDPQGAMFSIIKLAALP